eukprot:GFYU01049612.1.p1 GENE.GFYU01049612.1~~GFYU01049612.1.p1  ORF type:complete len:126 (+),score=15.50 GFYU01049612.1:37-378(+)
MSRAGYALTFRIPTDISNTSSATVPHQWKSNLRDKNNKYDQTPFLKDCRCFACRRHTRAYVHHLLNAHEMLADVLLTIHNVHHCYLLFEKLRDAVKANRFGPFKAAILDQLYA